MKIPVLRKVEEELGVGAHHGTKRRHEDFAEVVQCNAKQAEFAAFFKTTWVRSKEYFKRSSDRE